MLPETSLSGAALALGLDCSSGSPDVIACEYIAPTAIVVGDVHLSEGVSVWYGAVVRGDSGRIQIGPHTNIQDGAIVHGKTTVGNHVTIGHGATVHECHVDGATLVGINATVLTGARVAGGCIVAAGSVVRENFVVPPNTLVAGVPARVVRETRPEERAQIVKSSSEYVRLARSHRVAWTQAQFSGRGDPAS